MKATNSSISISPNLLLKNDKIMKELIKLWKQTVHELHKNPKCHLNINTQDNREKTLSEKDEETLSEEDEETLSEEDEETLSEEENDLLYKADITVIQNDLKKEVKKLAQEHKLEDNTIKIINESIDTTMNKVLNKYKDLFSTVLNPVYDREHWKIGVDEEDIKEVESSINAIYDIIENEKKMATEVGIMKSNLSFMEKKHALLLLEKLKNMEEYSIEYFDLERQIIELVKSSEKLKIKESLNEIEERLESKSYTNQNLYTRVLQAHEYIDDALLAHIYSKYKEYINMPVDSEMKVLTLNWLEHALKLPFNKSVEPIINKDNFVNKLLEIREFLDNEIYGMDNVKDQLLCILNNRFKNPKNSNCAIALHGSPGTGKTVIAKSLAKCMGLPFEQISLGGMQDASLLNGQHMGWLGSAPGRIVRALQNLNCKNGIIFFDELDKLGETTHGKEVQYALLHIIDYAQNNEFIDNFMGKELPLDLSNIIFIVAMNDVARLDSALLSRMPLVHVEDYTLKDKTKILKEYITPRIVENIGLDRTCFSIPDETCEYIIKKMEVIYGKEGGVRNIKDCMTFILNKVSLLHELYKQSSKKVPIHTNIKYSFPMNITRDIVDDFYTNKNQTDNISWQKLYT